MNRYAYDHPDPVVNNYLTTWVGLNAAIAHGPRYREEEYQEWLDFLDTWLTKAQKAEVEKNRHLIPGTFENPYE